MTEIEERYDQECRRILYQRIGIKALFRELETISKKDENEIINIRGTEYSEVRVSNSSFASTID